MNYFPIPTDMRKSRNILLEERADAVKIAIEWRIAAEKDGWVFTPTYSSESVDKAFKGNRDGFTLQGLTRSSDDKFLGGGEISMWGPDGMTIKVPLTYPGMNYFQDELRRCHHCGTDDVDTVRFSFAGRCCEKC